jgi:transposase
MARRRIGMKKIRKIIQLSQTSDLSRRQIAKAMNVSRPVVAQYIHDFQSSGLSLAQIETMADSQLLSVFEEKKKNKSTKYEELSGYFPYFMKELKKKGVTRQHLWQAYREKHPRGFSYTQFCYHFQVWRDGLDVTMHLDHKGGDKMFVDYAGTKQSIVDPITGQAKEVEVFVAILGASQLTYAEATPSQKSEDWIRSNERALRYMGGVTAAIVPDNLKSAISQSSPYEPGVNPQFDDFAEHYRTVILPARTQKAKDKALVENAVKLIYQRIYAPLRHRSFYSIEELNEAIWALLEGHNNTPFQRLKMSRRELFEQMERPALKPLPLEPYPLKQHSELKVQFNYHVELRQDRHYYSVPWQLKGKRVRMIYDERNVALYYDNLRLVQYRRDRTPNGYTTLPTHMPDHHRHYAEWSPGRFLNWAKTLGEDVLRMIRKILESRKHPEQAFKVCLGILNLVKKYDPERLNQACKRALSFEFYSYKAIKNILEKGLENEEQPALECPQAPLSDHENIRGSQYYQ